ncbi:MAG: hypothetical protein IJ514_02250 [Clostridia bacterium]|nr:hypothetical protein [Clostridia bacterium]
MTVVEIILAAATELGIADDVQAALEEGATAGEADAKNLLRCFNLVENELALDYLPLVAEESFKTDTGAVYFSEFSRSVSRILKVCDGSGNAVAFKIFPDYLKTQPDEVVVRYAYVPKEKGFTDESDFKAYASVRLFAYGIAAEYSLASGLFEEAAVWDKKYKEAITAAYRSHPCKAMASRRWV